MTKILLVDDSPTQRAMHKEALENNDYSVIEAGDGQEGLIKALAENPDLIITDMQMPKMNGFELVKTLKSKPGTKAIPIICTTETFKDQTSKDKAIELGAEDYLIETNTEQLLAKVVEVLQKARRQ